MRIRAKTASFFCALALGIASLPAPAHAGFWDSIGNGIKSVGNTLVNWGNSVQDLGNSWSNAGHQNLSAGGVLGTLGGAAQVGGGTVTSGAGGVMSWLGGMMGGKADPPPGGNSNNQQNSPSNQTTTTTTDPGGDPGTPGGNPGGYPGGNPGGYPGGHPGGTSGDPGGDPGGGTGGGPNIPAFPGGDGLGGGREGGLSFVQPYNPPAGGGGGDMTPASPSRMAGLPGVPGFEEAKACDYSDARCPVEQRQQIAMRPGAPSYPELAGGAGGGSGGGSASLGFANSLKEPGAGGPLTGKGGSLSEAAAMAAAGGGPNVSKRDVPGVKGGASGRVASMDRESFGKWKEGEGKAPLLRDKEAQPGESAEKARSLLSGAQKDLKDRRWDKAIDKVTQALKLDPGNDELYSTRAMAYNMKGDFAAAEKDAQTAVRLNPKNAQAYENLAWAQLKQGKYKEAVESATRAIQLNPKGSLAYAIRAYAKEKLGDRQGGIQDIGKAASLDSRFEKQLQAGLAGKPIYDEDDDYSVYFVGDASARPLGVPMWPFAIGGLLLLGGGAAFAYRRMRGGGGKPPALGPGAWTKRPAVKPLQPPGAEGTSSGG